MIRRLGAGLVIAVGLACGSDNPSGANGSGGYSASVPLDFSPVDASVPVPIKELDHVYNIRDGLIRAMEIRK